MGTLIVPEQFHRSRKTAAELEPYQHAIADALRNIRTEKAIAESQKNVHVLTTGDRD